MRARRERDEALALLASANCFLAAANSALEALSRQLAFEREQATNAYRIARTLAEMLLRQDLPADEAASLEEWRRLLADTAALREEHLP